MKNETNKFYVMEHNVQTGTIRLIGIYRAEEDADAFASLKNRNAPRDAFGRLFTYEVKDHEGMIRFFDYSLDTNAFGIILPW